MRLENNIGNVHCKKYFILILIVSFMFVLIGCGNDNIDEDNSSSSENEKLSNSVKKEEPSVGSKKISSILEDAREYKGHYYKTFDFWVTWDDAQKFCESVGGHLATAESPEECEIINEVLKNSSTGDYYHWLGAKGDSRGIWKWITGDIIIYSNWAENEPAAIDNYDRIRIADSGKWYSHSSSNDKEDRELVICEWDSVEDAHDTDF